MIEPKEKKEVVIGTDSTESAGQVTLEFRAPTLDAIDSRLHLIHCLLENGGEPIQAFDLDVIHCILDRLDQLQYWCAEENAALDLAIQEAREPPVNSPLVAFNDRLLALMEKILATRRPKLCIGAFRCLKHLSKHPSRCGCFVESVLPKVADMITSFPKIEDLVQEGIAVVVACARNDVDAVLQSDAVSATLQAMQVQAGHLAIQREGCLLVAAIVDGKRRDPLDIPVSILLVHVGVVVDFVCRAYRQQPQETTISSAVAHVFSALTRYQQNLESLASHSMVMSTLRHLAEHHVYNPKTVHDALLSISALLPELDRLQKRSIALTVKELMTKTADSEILASAIALILAIVRSTESVPLEAEQPAVEAAVPSLARHPPTSSAEKNEMREFLCAQQIPQLVAIALDHFGDDDDVLREIASSALRELVISKLW